MGAVDLSSPSSAPLKVQRKCACGGTCPRCSHDEATVQPKLKIGEPADRYEREADDVADRVMRGNGTGPLLASSRPTVRPSHLASHAISRTDAGNAPPSVHTALSSQARPLPADARTFFESRFGADFSGVRIHSEPVAQQAAHEIGARAFTVGRDIVFGAGEFVPGSAEGRHLLAHELAHVIQQEPSTPYVARERDVDDSPKKEPPVEKEAPGTRFQGHCDRPDCKLCPWLAEAFFLHNMYQIRPSDLFGECDVDIIIEGCRYHESKDDTPPGFSCWGKAVIACPRSGPDEFAFTVRHPAGTETFIVESGSTLCEFERECPPDEHPAPDEPGALPVLRLIRCIEV